jgi:hypothetical protein
MEPRTTSTTLTSTTGTKTLTPLTLPHHNFIQLKSKSRANIQLQQQQQELSSTTKLSDIQKKNESTLNSSMMRSTPESIPSTASSVRVFGDEKSAVHSQRAKLCIETLMEGCIDAFAELFELSHRAPVVCPFDFF